MDIPHFVYLFFHQWTLGYFYLSAIMNKADIYLLASVCTYIFISLGYIRKSSWEESFAHF